MSGFVNPATTSSTTCCSVGVRLPHPVEARLRLPRARRAYATASVRESSSPRQNASDQSSRPDMSWPRRHSASTRASAGGIAAQPSSRRGAGGTQEVRRDRCVTKFQHHRGERLETVGHIADQVGLELERERGMHSYASRFDVVGERGSAECQLGERFLAWAAGPRRDLGERERVLACRFGVAAGQGNTRQRVLNEGRGVKRRFVAQSFGAIASRRQVAEGELRDEECDLHGRNRDAEVGVSSSLEQRLPELSRLSGLSEHRPRSHFERPGDEAGHGFVGTGEFERPVGVRERRTRIAVPDLRPRHRDLRQTAQPRMPTGSTARRRTLRTLAAHHRTGRACPRRTPGRRAQARAQSCPRRLAAPRRRVWPGEPLREDPPRSSSR